MIRRIRKTDNNRIARVTGATIVNRAEELEESHVGTECGLFEIKKIGDEYFTFLTECAQPKACTVLLRYGGRKRSSRGILVLEKKCWWRTTRRSCHDPVPGRSSLVTTCFRSGGGAPPGAVLPARRSKLVVQVSLHLIGCLDLVPTTDQVVVFQDVCESR